MSPKEKLESRIKELEESVIPIDRDAPGYWSTVTDGKLDYNARVYHHINEAKYLLKYLFEEEE